MDYTSEQLARLEELMETTHNPKTEEAFKKAMLSAPLRVWEDIIEAMYGDDIDDIAQLSVIGYVNDWWTQKAYTQLDEEIAQAEKEAKDMAQIDAWEERMGH